MSSRTFKKNSYYMVVAARSHTYRHLGEVILMMAEGRLRAGHGMGYCASVRDPEGTKGYTR